MLEVDDSELTREQIEFLQEWANALSVSVEVLLGRIVVATIDGYLYIERIPDYYPEDSAFIEDSDPNWKVGPDDMEAPRP